MGDKTLGERVYELEGELGQLQRRIAACEVALSYITKVVTIPEPLPPQNEPERENVAVPRRSGRQVRINGKWVTQYDVQKDL